MRKALTGTALNHDFAIPAGEANHEVRSSWTAKEDIRIVDLMPHMHVRGKDFTYMLKVTRYDFNWQLLYQRAALPTQGQPPRLRGALRQLAEQ